MKAGSASHIAEIHMKRQYIHTLHMLHMLHIIHKYYTRLTDRLCPSILPVLVPVFEQSLPLLVLRLLIKHSNRVGLGDSGEHRRGDDSHDGNEAPENPDSLSANCSSFIMRGESKDSPI